MKYDLPHDHKGISVLDVVIFLLIIRQFLVEHGEVASLALQQLSDVVPEARHVVFILHRLTSLVQST